MSSLSLCVLGIESVTFLVCMSSWEKWVFPLEVNAFSSPSFSLALPLHVAYSLPPPETFHSVLFFSTISHFKQS